MLKLPLSDRFHPLYRTPLQRIGLAVFLMATAACGDDDDEPSKEQVQDGGADAGGSSGGGDAGTGGGADAGGGGGGNLTGSYTVDGQRKNCKVETQLFGATDEFSVLCQNDDDGLIQITFKDEASARLAQTLRIIKTDILEHPDADTISVDYRPFDDRDTLVSDDDKAGTASVTKSGSRNVLTLTDVALESFEGTSSGVVSATITF